MTYDEWAESGRAGIHISSGRMRNGKIVAESVTIFDEPEGATMSESEAEAKSPEEEPEGYVSPFVGKSQEQCLAMIREFFTPKPKPEVKEMD